jgi:hypothetical protein
VRNYGAAMTEEVTGDYLQLEVVSEFRILHTQI